MRKTSSDRMQRFIEALWKPYSRTVVVFPPKRKLRPLIYNGLRCAGNRTWRPACCLTPVIPVQSASNILPDETISSNIEQPVKMLLLSGKGKLLGKNKPAKTDYYLMYLTLAISHRYTIPFRGFFFFWGVTGRTIIVKCESFSFTTIWGLVLQSMVNGKLIITMNGIQKLSVRIITAEVCKKSPAIGFVCRICKNSGRRSLSLVSA